MQSIPLTLLSLCLGLCVGAATSKTLHRQSVQNDRNEGAPESEIIAPLSRVESVPLLSVSETIDFGHLSATKQKEVVTRLAKRIERFHSQSDLLLLSKAVRNLSFEQAAELLSSLDASHRVRSGMPEQDAFTIICERMAALDLERALKNGVESKNVDLVRAALNTLRNRSPALALSALAELPAELREVQGEGFLRPFVPKGSSDGALSDIYSLADVLKKHPNSFLESASLRNQFEVDFFGAALRISNAKIKGDPTEMLASLREMTEPLRQAAQSLPGSEGSEVADHFFLRTARYLIEGMHLGIYDSLQDQEKKPYLAEAEARRLYEASGQEAAMQFVERQTDADFLKNALAGVADRLGQEKTFQWAELIAEGPAKQGVMLKLAHDAITNQPGESYRELLIQAGNRFKSDDSRVSFFTTALQDRYLSYWLQASSNRSTFSDIENLPVSNAFKSELWKRTAAIPAK